jgi:hypothetical protein
MVMLAFLANWGGQLIFNMAGDKYGRKTMSIIGSMATTFTYIALMMPITVSLTFFYMGLIGFMNAYFL